MIECLRYTSTAVVGHEAVEEFGLNDTWERDFDGAYMHAQGVFDMFRLLYAATQPLPMVIHSRHSALHRLLHVSPASRPLALEEIFSLALGW